MTDPQWISSKTVTITKTVNGYAVGAHQGAQTTELLTFETFSALMAWLDTRWDAP